MYSLTKIIRIMLWRGGWIDTKRHKLLRDISGIENNVTINKTLDEEQNIVSVDYDSPDYVRIPNIGPARSMVYLVKKNNISSELLEKYGVLGYVDKKYPLFEDDGKSACFPTDNEYFSSRVCLLADDYGFDLPDVSEYAMDEIMKWCSDNGVDVFNDYSLH